MTAANPSMTTMKLGSFDCVFNKNMWRNYFTPELFWISGYRSKGMAALLSLSTDFSRGRPKETATVIKYAQRCETLKGKIDQSDGAVLKDTVLVYKKSGRTLGGQKLGQDTVGAHCPVTGNISAYELR